MRKGETLKQVNVIDRNGKIATEKNGLSERLKQYFEGILSERNERSAELTTASQSLAVLQSGITVPMYT